jgi:membrane protein DedA with SNARE-associated domain
MSHLLETWGYLAIFVLTLLESACVPIPSEVTLGVSGALASGAVISGIHADLNLAVVIAVGTAGSLVGCLIAYCVGRTGGRVFVEHFGGYVLLSHRDLDRAEAWFARRGDWVVLVGRVVPVVRTFISLPAGLAEMKVTTFALFSAIGVAVWVTLLSSIGYAMGDSWTAVTDRFSFVSYVVGIVIAVAIAGFVVLRLRARHAERGTWTTKEGQPNEDLRG